jgi:DNA mismatch repair ATPase MutS
VTGNWIDQQTLRDLDIIDGRGGTSLFGLLDRTRTPAGGARLRERFLAPLTDPAAISDVQRSLRFIDANTEWFRISLEPRTIAALEHYLRSPYSILLASGQAALRVEILWVRLRYPEIARSALAGVAVAAAVTSWTYDLCSRILQHDPPSLLRVVAEEAIAAISEIRAHPRAARFGQRRLSGTEAMLADTVLRGVQLPAMKRVRAVVAELDALISMAAVTRELRFSYPDIHATGGASFSIAGLHHPFLTNPVANDVELGGDGRLIFLTGPNMAGKTTLLKACGIAVYLAHLGMGVPASGMRFTPVRCLVSSINTEDNIRRGYSYYFAEVQRIREIAERLTTGDRCVVLCDEVFKGTNVHDALDASRAVIRGFAGRSVSCFIVSSHLVELVPDLASISGIRFHCFEADIENGEPRYDYRLRTGHSAQRLGLLLLERAGVIQLLNGGRRS